MVTYINIITKRLLSINVVAVLVTLTMIQLNSTIASEINRELFRRHLSQLGSDEFMGRGTGQLGGSMAADYIASQFLAMGLSNPKGLKFYHQNIPFHETKIIEGTLLEITSPSGVYQPLLNVDYLIHKSGSASIIPKPVNMAFVGFGIIAPEYDYNDYRNINVENKVVVMFSGEPKSDDKSFFYGPINSKYSQIDKKRQTALSQGARACIIIPNPEEFSYEYWGSLIYEYSFPEMSLAYSPSDLLTVLFIPSFAEKLFESEVLNLENLNELYFQNKLFSFDLISEMSFKGVFKDRSFTDANVIGYIEGSDSELKDSYVIVTAHYDHFGIGPKIGKDSIYNGVLDNAMGVAGVLEIARSISFRKEKPRRSVIFLLTTAEEKGILGSIHYVTNPIFPLYKTIANINIDGLAFIDNFRSVVGIGANLSDLGKHIDYTAKQSGLYVQSFPQEFREIESFNRSDQVVFASEGIPAIMVMDGTDYLNIPSSLGIQKLNQYMESIYHTPYDDLNLLINFDATYQHLDYLLNLVVNVANAKQEPEWDKSSHYYYEQRKLKNEKR